MILANIEEKKLFYLLISELKATFPILATYQEPNIVTKWKFHRLLKLYAQVKMSPSLEKNKSSCKLPTDFQTTENRLSFLM